MPMFEDSEKRLKKFSIKQSSSYEQITNKLTGFIKKVYWTDIESTKRR